MNRKDIVGPSHLWDMKREFQFNHLTNRGLLPSNVFMDIGCGAMRNLKTLEYLDTGNYHGCDISKERLLEGAVELEDNNLSYKIPKLLHFNDFRELEFSYKFDKMLAFSVFIHLNDNVLDSCLSFISTSLDANGYCWANVNIGERDSSQWKEFSVHWRSMNFYLDMADKHDLYCVSEGSLASLGHNSGNELGDNQIMLRLSLKNK